jgi:glycosyltransferase involved in cell wall biosynthesis
VKLLIVINSLILAGAEVLVADLAPLLEERGIDVTFYLLKKLHGPLEARLHQRKTDFLENHSNRIYSPAHVFELRPRLRDYDLVHTHLFPAQLWVALARKNGGKRPVFVTTEHNTENHRRKGWLRPLDLYFYRQYDHIISNSGATHRRLFEWLPELKVESSVIENGISLSRFKNANGLNREELGVPARAPLLVSVARLQRQKDHVTILRAFAKVPSSAHLLLVGDGELRSELEKLAQDLGVSERTHFLGRRADVPSVLRTADIFIHATHSDGFCLAVVEAMAAGLPVVVTGVAGLTEVVGDAGVQVAPQAADQMAEEISHLLASQSLRAELCRKGQARAQKFDIATTADAYAALYERLLRTKSFVAGAST